MMFRVETQVSGTAQVSSRPLAPARTSSTTPVDVLRFWAPCGRQRALVSH